MSVSDALFDACLDNCERLLLALEAISRESDPNLMKCMAADARMAVTGATGSNQKQRSDA